MSERPSSNNRAASKTRIAFRKRSLHLAFSVLLASATLAVPVKAASQKGSEAKANATVTPTPTPTANPTPAAHFKPESSNSTGSVTVEGGRVDYQAVAGTLVVHPKGWDDAATTEEKKTKESEESRDESKDDDESKNPTAEASMFYVAYTVCWTPAIWSSWTLPAPASVASPGKTRRKSFKA